VGSGPISRVAVRSSGLLGRDRAGPPTAPIVTTETPAATLRARARGHMRWTGSRPGSSTTRSSSRCCSKSCETEGSRMRRLGLTLLVGPAAILLLAVSATASPVAPTSGVYY
jgi:hypothetical protein